MDSMKNYAVSAITSLNHNVMLVSLEPQTPDDIIAYTAGQYLALGFTRNGRKTPMRSFSIVSSPTGGTELQVSMRVQGNFTSAASELTVGDEVFVQGPFGSFTINPYYDKRIVMMAAGIGITPFISMLRWAAETSLAVPITLLYSCRTAADMAFYQEILALQQSNANLEVGFFVTGANDGPANFVKGPIREAHIQRLTEGEYAGSTYFICGPKGFMQAQESALLHQGVDASRVITESFTQSSKLFSFNGWGASKLTYAFAGLLVLVGVGGIMALDLLRAVPKLASAQSIGTTSTNVTPVPTTSIQPTTQTVDPASTTTTAPTTSPQTNTNTRPNNYMQPMSSVS